MKQRELKDRVVLLLSGLAAASAAWTFWHYLGEHAFPALGAIVILALILDNRRLRKSLMRHETDHLQQ